MAQIQLQATPNDFAETRESLHRVAEQIVSPARAAATGEAFSLVALPGGFGTPALPGQDRVRVDGLDLVVEGSDGGEQRVRLTSLAESARAVGLPADGLSDEPLTLNLAAAEVLAAAYTFGDGVLRALYGEAETSASATMPELWPEHFDVAIEHGDAATGSPFLITIDSGFLCCDVCVSAVVVDGSLFGLSSRKPTIAAAATASKIGSDFLASISRAVAALGAVGGRGRAS